jgi:hypothetical protein
MTNEMLGSNIDPNWKSSKNPDFPNNRMVMYDNQATSDSKQKTLRKGENEIEGR